MAVAGDFNDRLRGRGAAMRLALRRGQRALTAPARALASRVGRAPKRLVLAPPDLRTTDPTVARDIYAGYFVFSGKAVSAGGRSPFAVPPPSRAWAEALHGFGWLRHLRGAGTGLARANARALLAEWIDGPPRERRPRLRRFVDRSGAGGLSNQDDVRWSPRVTARRLISLLAHSAFLLEDADARLYARVMRLLQRHVAVLRAGLADPADGRDALLASLALAHHALSADATDRDRERALKRLGDELGRQILPDGGHLSRDPQVLIDLMLDLLPVRHALAARGLALPEPIVAALERVPPMLRLFRHGDNNFALFNGMSATPHDHVAAVLAHGDPLARAIEAAGPSGYQRLEAGPTVVVIDAGAPPPPADSRCAGAGCLSFEMSSGRARIVVNCGAPPFGEGDAREASRRTPAHSTLSIADGSSCRFGRAEAGAPILHGPRDVPVEREEEPKGARVSAAHDGWLAQHGLVHRREWLLSANGGTLAGEDRLEAPPRGRLGPEPKPYALRFHLHPDVVATPNGDGVRLQLADGEAWEFAARSFATDGAETGAAESGEAAPASVEDSIFFAAAHGHRATRQIVLRGVTAAAEAPGTEAPGTEARIVARLAWSFRRTDAPSS